jgi:hypothetical protein
LHCEGLHQLIDLCFVYTTELLGESQQQRLGQYTVLDGEMQF